MCLFTMPVIWPSVPRRRLLQNNWPNCTTRTLWSARRVNRAALPVMRKQRRRLLIWYAAAVRPRHTQYLSPYFAARAAMDALAVQYAHELTFWGIETSIVVLGAFTSGTSHFAHAGTLSRR